MRRKKHEKEREEPTRIPVESGEQAAKDQAEPHAEAAAAAGAAPNESEAAEPKALDTQALTVERDDLLARLQRVSADFVNYQKRVQRDIAEAREFANAELMRELLGVLDDMERALEAAKVNHSQDDPLLAGMQLVYAKALEVLSRFGLQPIEAEGKPFDPSRHEAMLQQPSAEYKNPTVLGELQRGYELKGRVLRPARVVVSAPSQQEQGPDDEQTEAGASEDE